MFELRPQGYKLKSKKQPPSLPRWRVAVSASRLILMLLTTAPLDLRLQTLPMSDVPIERVEKGPDDKGGLCLRLQCIKKQSLCTREMVCASPRQCLHTVSELDMIQVQLPIPEVRYVDT
jgi:hypothetical protein